MVPAYPEDKLETFLFEGVNRKVVRDMPCSIIFLKATPEDMA
jgi:hypothetical protein